VHHQKLFFDGALSRPAGEITALPTLNSQIWGGDPKGRGRTQRERRERARKAEGRRWERRRVGVMVPYWHVTFCHL